jgi:hypothetical protein
MGRVHLLDGFVLLDLQCSYLEFIDLLELCLEGFNLGLGDLDLLLVKIDDLPSLGQALLVLLEVKAVSVDIFAVFDIEVQALLVGDVFTIDSDSLVPQSVGCRKLGVVVAGVEGNRLISVDDGLDSLGCLVEVELLCEVGVVLTVNHEALALVHLERLSLVHP